MTGDGGNCKQDVKELRLDGELEVESYGWERLVEGSGQTSCSSTEVKLHQRTGGSLKLQVLQ